MDWTNPSMMNINLMTWFYQFASRLSKQGVFWNSKNRLPTTRTSCVSCCKPKTKTKWTITRLRSIDWKLTINSRSLKMIHSACRCDHYRIFPDLFIKVVSAKQRDFWQCHFLVSCKACQEGTICSKALGTVGNGLQHPIAVLLACRQEILDLACHVVTVTKFYSTRRQFNFLFLCLYITSFPLFMLSIYNSKLQRSLF